MKRKRSHPHQSVQPIHQREPFGLKTLVAGIIDGLIILTIYCIVFGIPDYTHGKTADPVILIVLAIVYTFGLNTSAAKRTIGRMAIGIY